MCIKPFAITIGLMIKNIQEPGATKVMEFFSKEHGIGVWMKKLVSTTPRIFSTKKGNGDANTSTFWKTDANYSIERYDYFSVVLRAVYGYN